MKKILIIILTTLICAFVFFSGVKCFQLFFLSEPNIINKVLSPDDKYIAYVFESNGGSTTGFIYHVSILEKNKSLNNGSGNVYISTVPPTSVEWMDVDILYIDDYKSVNITKQKKSFKNVTIKYNSLGD